MAEARCDSSFSQNHKPPPNKMNSNHTEHKQLNQSGCTNHQPNSRSQTTSSPTVAGKKPSSGISLKRLSQSSDELPVNPHHTNPPRSPSPRYRSHSGSTSPNTRSPTPTGGGFAAGNLCNVVINDGEAVRSLSDEVGGEGGSYSGVSDNGGDVRTERKVKSVSFHSHTNWKSERKIQSGEYYTELKYIYFCMC